MKIVVCAKFVPDATAGRRFCPEDNTVDRASVVGLLSELDENAIEAALAIKEARSGDGSDVEVTVLTVGPEQAADAVKKALGKLEHDLVVFGMESTDGAMGVVPAMVAERLGLPAVTLGSEVSVHGSTVRIRRDGDASSDTIEGTLPLVLSVTDAANEPRYPSFKGIMAAKKKPVQTWALSDLGVSADEVGGSVAWSQVTGVTARPPRTAGTIVTDSDGTGAAQLVEFLSVNKFL